MRLPRFFFLILSVFVLTAYPLQKAYCNSKGESGEGGHEEPAGASFKAGKGVILTEEVRKILGLQIVDVMEEKLPKVIHFNVQVFGEKHRFPIADMDHSGCDIHGSGLLPPARAAAVQPKQLVKLRTSENEELDGFVLSVKKGVALGETEIIVGIMSASEKLKDGEFVAATITLPREEAVPTIPKEALLKTSQGAFVYVVNGDAYSRTAVTVGSESDNQIEIADGLYSGDQVVTKPVETLWLIELRATKGGGHSH